MDDGTVLVERNDGFMVITLNRPDKLNAFNETQHATLRAALDEADADHDCRAVMLTGAGRGFCAGQDLGDRDFSDGAPDLGITIDTLYNPLIRKIRAMEIPIVCAVNGVAAGAGANVALACDIVLAARSAKFIQAFSKIGLVPDSGGTWTVTHLVGEARAKAMMLTGDPVPAETAERWGLIWQAVDDDNLEKAARDLTRRFAAGPTVGLGLTKRIVQQAATNTLDQQLDLERDTQRQAGRTPDYQEGVSAFLEKRKPNYSGRA